MTHLLSESVRRLRLAAALVVGTLLLLTSAGVYAEETASRIARGGLLYDKWFKVVGMDTPTEAHAAYPAEGKYRGKKGSDWRCKECHGWDYMGRDGAYASGKHRTGITGIRAASGRDPAEIVAILKNGTHGYSDALMDAADLDDLALFVSQGQVNMDSYIDRASKRVKGDAANGEGYYNTVCAHCHGKDGKAIEDGEAIGHVARANPWEALHKVRNGQPDEQMPSMLLFDPQLLRDILAYAQTLPED